MNEEIRQILKNQSTILSSMSDFIKDINSINSIKDRMEETYNLLNPEQELLTDKMKDVDLGGEDNENKI